MAQLQSTIPQTTQNSSGVSAVVSGLGQGINNFVGDLFETGRFVGNGFRMPTPSSNKTLTQNPFMSALPLTPNGNIINPTSKIPTAVTPTVVKDSTTPNQQTPAVSISESPSDIQGKINVLKNTIASDTGTTFNQTNGFTDQPFTIDHTQATTDMLNSPTTYSDVLRRRQQLEDQYMQAYQQYAQTKTAEQQGQLTDLGREQNALYSGDTTDFGLGLAGLVRNQDIIKQAARQVQTQGALLQTQGLQNMIGFNQQDFQNQLSAAPNTVTTQVTPTGDIVSVVRDPITGALSSKVTGNVYGSANGTQSGGFLGQLVGSYADQVLSGKMTRADAQTALGNNLVFNSMLDQAIQTGNPNFNTNASNTIGGQQYQTLLNSFTTTSAHLDELGKAIDNQSFTSNIPIINDAFNFVKSALGSPVYQDYITKLGVARGEIANLLSNAGTPTDSARSEAESILPNVPPNQLKTAISAAKQLMVEKIQSYGGLGGGSVVNQNQPSSSAGRTGNPSVGWF